MMNVEIAKAAIAKAEVDIVTHRDVAFTYNSHVARRLASNVAVAKTLSAAGEISLAEI
jgi:hypothetical protein